MTDGDLVIVDFHNHLGVDPGAELSQTPEELIARMDEAGIDLAVIFPFSGSADLSAGNSYVRDAKDRYPERFIRFAAVNPREHRGRSNEDIMAAIRAETVKGVMIDPRMHHFSLRSELVDPLMQACTALRLPVLVHLVGHGLDDCSPVADMARRHPGALIVVSPLIHCPGWERIAGGEPNLYADTAKPMYPPHLDQLVTALGADRVLFGSETPMMSPLIELEKFRYSAIKPAVQQQIQGGNASRILLQH
jgi:hypothetical protein